MGMKGLFRVVGGGQVRSVPAASSEGIKLTPTEKQDFMRRAEALRNAFNNTNSFDEKVGAIENAFKGEGYLAHPKFQELIATLIADTQLSDYANTRTKVDSLVANGSNIILGVFKIKSEKRDSSSGEAELVEVPSFEALSFDKIDQNGQRLARRFHSNAVLLTDVTTTAGLANVFKDATIFPEHCLSKNKGGKDSSAYYILNRFKDRTRAYTFAVLDNHVDASAFPVLRKFKRDENALIGAAANWLGLGHEHYHREGLVPGVPTDNKNIDQLLNEELQKFREANPSDTRSDVEIKDRMRANHAQATKLKRQRETAAFDELGADLNAIIAWYSDAVRNDHADGQEKAKLTAETILAERLFRYGVQYSPNKDFDSITSLMLFNFLLHKEAICISRDGHLSMQDDQIVIRALKEFKSEIDRIEREVSINYDLSNADQLKSAKAHIQRFVREWALYHERDNDNLMQKVRDGSFDYKSDYTVHPFHTQAKRKSVDPGLRRMGMQPEAAHLYGPVISESTVSFANLLQDKHTLDVYGDKLKDKSDKDFYRFIKDLPDGVEYAPGDALLKSITQGAPTNISDFRDLIDKLQKGYTLDGDEQHELASLLHKKYCLKSGLKTYDDRFLSRLWKIIRAKYNFCSDSECGPETIRFLRELQRSQNNNRWLVTVGGAACAALLLLATASNCRSSAESNLVAVSVVKDAGSGHVAVPRRVEERPNVSNSLHQAQPVRLSIAQQTISADDWKNLNQTTSLPIPDKHKDIEPSIRRILLKIKAGNHIPNENLQDIRYCVRSDGFISDGSVVINGLLEKPLINISSGVVAKDEFTVKSQLPKSKAGR